MVHGNLTRTFSLSQRHNVRLSVMLAVLMFAVLLGNMASTSCVGEPAARLTVENRMPYDVAVINETTNPQATYLAPETLGTVPAGQTVKLQTLVPLNPGILGETVLLEAKDPSGNIVWKRKWPFSEFLKLGDQGWKIVVSPETGQ